MACAVFAGQPGRSAARKSDAYSLAPVTLATPSMRPTPVAAGFHACRPGKVSRAAKLGSSAIARRDMLRAMPLAVTDLTNSRREILIVPRLSLPERLVLRVHRYPCLDPKIKDRMTGKDSCCRHGTHAKHR